jgi:hypothetical protein
MGLVWNLHSWNKHTICRYRSAVEGLVHVDDGIETGSRSRSSIDKKYYSPLYRDYLLYLLYNAQEEEKIKIET